MKTIILLPRSWSRMTMLYSEIKITVIIIGIGNIAVFIASKNEKSIWKNYRHDNDQNLITYMIYYLFKFSTEQILCM